MRPTNKLERALLKRTKTRAPKERAPLYDKWIERRLMTASLDEWDGQPNTPVRVSQQQHRS